MKKTLLLGLGAVAMAFAAGAGIGLNSLAEKNDANLVSAHAWENLDDVWLGNSVDKWNKTASNVFTYVGDTKDGSKNCADFEIVVPLKVGDEFKVVANDHWSNSFVGYATFTVPDNIRCGTAGTYKLHFRTNFSDVYYIYQIDSLGSGNKTIYFVNDYSWGNLKCHHYDFVGSGTSWAGEAMTATNLKLKCKVGDAWFSGIGIYELSVPKSHNWLIFSNNGSEQTSTYYAKEGGIYYKSLSSGTYGEIVQLLLNIDSKMASGSYSGRSYTSTICGMSKEDADGLISAYNTIVSKRGDSETSVKGSQIVTNDYTKPDGNTALYTIETIMDVLSKTVSANKTNPAFVINQTENNVAPIAVLCVATVSIAFIGFAILRVKRKAE